GGGGGGGRGPRGSVLGYRAYGQGGVDATPSASVCAGDQEDPPAPAGGGELARGVRHPGGGQADPGHNGVADQHCLHRARQPPHPPTCGGSRPAGHNIMQRRGRLTSTARGVSGVLQFLFAACQLTPALTAARSDERDGRDETLAPVYAGDGRGADRPRLDTTRGVSVSRAAVVPALRAGGGS